MTKQRSSTSYLRITEGSLAADWVAQQARPFGRRLSAVQKGARPVHLFVNDELLVRHDDLATIELLKSRYDATLEAPRPIPPQPKGMDPDRRRSTEGMPTFARLRFRGEHVPLDGLEANVPRELLESQLGVTSRAGAGTLALATLLRSDGRRVLLNAVGQSEALPASFSNEGMMAGGVTDAYQLPEFGGRSQVARAWQLFNAYSQVKGLASPVFLGIFDTGFALNAQNNFSSADFPVLIRYNLNQEGQSAGGPNNEAGKEWHGTGTVSAAAALVGNNTGAAGSGGLRSGGNFPVVVPVLFKTFRSVEEVVRGLQLSVAWGVDVVNFSFTITYHWPSTEPGDWDDAFQFAADQGIVIVAGAGNSGFHLPDDSIVVPATRTPGTITVGWLDPHPSVGTDWDRANGRSNYGSSVDIWAPGTNIHVIPEQPGGTFSGTSAAAPIVAGVVSLMKAIQPALNTGTAKAILRDTAYHPGDPKVTAALDAYAALLRTMGDQLPPGTIEEPNNAPSQARTLLPDPTGALTPVGVTTLSRASDVDWWEFKLDQYSTCEVSVKFVPELSTLHVELLPLDPDSPAPGKFQLVSLRGEHRIVTTILPPGRYRIMVRAGAPNIYELRVTTKAKPLESDGFEINDSFDGAALFSMDHTVGDRIVVGPHRRIFRPGSYDANLHVPTDVDFFHIADVPMLALIECSFTLLGSDAPLDVTVFRSDKTTVFKQQNGIRTGTFSLPAPDCWVRVSGATTNQYSFLVASRENDDLIPPLVDDDPIPVPHWWPDPPFRLHQWEQYLRVDVTEELKQIGKLRLTGAPGLTLDVVSPVTGEVLASGAKRDPHSHDVLEVDVSELPEGTHLLRIGRDLDPSERLNRRAGTALVTFNVGPAW